MNCKGDVCNVALIFASNPHSTHLIILFINMLLQSTSWDKWRKSAAQGWRCGWCQTCLAIEVEYVAIILHVSAHLRVPVHLHVLKY
jgi:hypothetical protein